MSENLEIEFKTLLSSENYQLLCEHYKLKEKDFFTQTNVYYDTPDGKLKEMDTGLRIRLYPDRGEATLKTRDQAGRLETNDALELEEAKLLITEKNFLHSGEIVEKLEKLGVKPESLEVIADLTTKRAEFPISEGLLAIDESWYSDQHDFELELEVADYKKGRKDFEALLTRFGINYLPAQNKIQRAVAAKNNKRS